jgi:hypothetical protein
LELLLAPVCAWQNVATLRLTASGAIDAMRRNLQYRISLLRHKIRKRGVSAIPNNFIVQFSHLIGPNANFASRLTEIDLLWRYPESSCHHDDVSHADGEPDSTHKHGQGVEVPPDECAKREPSKRQDHVA